MSDQDGAAVNAIAALAQKGVPQIVEAEVHPDSDRRWLVVPQGMQAQEITDPHGLKPRPAHVSQAIALQTDAALTTYVNRFKTDDTMLFADVNKSAIVGVLDYHSKSAIAGNSMANHSVHRATLALQHSEEWKEWTGINGKLLDKLDFVRFLEENRRDVVQPDAATLLEACRTLQALKKVTFKSTVRDNTDHQNFEFREEVDGGSGADGKIAFPSDLTIAIPVFYGDDPVIITAFLRWNIVDGRLTLGIKLKNLEKVKQTAFGDIAETIQIGTDVPLVFGALA